MNGTSFLMMGETNLILIDEKDSLSHYQLWEGFRSSPPRETLAGSVSSGPALRHIFVLLLFIFVYAGIFSCYAHLVYVGMIYFCYTHLVYVEMVYSYHIH